MTHCQRLVRPLICRLSSVTYWSRLRRAAAPVVRSAAVTSWLRQSVPVSTSHADWTTTLPTNCASRTPPNRRLCKQRQNSTLTELPFHAPLDTKQIISETFPQGLIWKKTKPNTTIVEAKTSSIRPAVSKEHRLLTDKLPASVAPVFTHLLQLHTVSQKRPLYCFE